MLTHCWHNIGPVSQMVDHDWASTFHRPSVNHKDQHFPFERVTNMEDKKKE